MSDAEPPRAFPFSTLPGLELDPTFAQLRREEPVSRIRLPYGGDGWLVVGYDDVRAVTTDRRFSRAAAVGPDVPRLTAAPPGGSALTLMDPPGHSRLRSLLATAFTARRVAGLRPGIEELSSELLTELVRDGAPADLMAGFALPLPVRVICELMGVPYADRAHFSGLASMLLSSTAHQPDEVAWAVGELSDYLADLIDDRRDNPRDDLIGALVRARDSDDRLSEAELVTMCGTILAAGYENVANAIGNFSFVLLTRPDLLSQLAADPTLVPAAVEELLRYVVSGLAVSHPRIATEDLDLGGVRIHAGDAVFTSMPAANHDPSVFPEPERVDFRRGGPDEAKQLAFGYGIHHCVGSALARVELQVALSSILLMLPGITLAQSADSVDWKIGFTVRGPRSLQVAW